MHKLVVFGSARIDAFMQLPAKEADQLCSLDTKLCVIQLAYSAKLPLRQVDFLTGGNGANVAIGAKRLGVESTLVCELGEGMLAEKVFSDLDKEIHTKYVSRTPGVRQGFGAVINYQGERTILSYYAPTRPVFPHDVEPAEWAYLTSIGDNFEEFYEEVYTWLENNKTTRVAFNPGGRQIKKGKEWLSKYLARTEVLLVNREEAQDIVGLKNTHGNEKQLLDALHETGPRICVVTDGREGSFVKADNDYLRVGILPIDAIERTGAGDASSAGFISALISGESLETALVWATVNSASVIGFIGPEDGLIKKEDLPVWLERAKSSDLLPQKF